MNRGRTIPDKRSELRPKARLQAHLRLGCGASRGDAQRPISATLGKDNSRYWAHANADGFSAENPQHALGINFTRLGVELESHNLRWGLETRGYGYGDVMLPLSAAAPHLNHNRVEYLHRGVTEWYENGPMGLEQGFLLVEPPGKAKKGRNQPLTLALAISGDLLAALGPAGLDKKSTALTLTRKNLVRRPCVTAV